MQQLDIEIARAAEPQRARGEIKVGGLRFAKKIVTKTKGANGQVNQVTIEVDKVVLNEAFAADYFTAPLLLPKDRKSTRLNSSHT